MDLTILVIEGNRALRKGLGETLEEEGYHVKRVKKEEVRSLLTQEVDLILMDLDFGQGFGETILRYVKSQPALRDIEIIAISSIDSSEKTMELIDLGGHSYILKRNLEKELLERVEDAYRQRVRRLILNRVKKREGDPKRGKAKVIRGVFG